jgi:hypothetical protein
MLPLRITIAKRGFPSLRAYQRASKTAHAELGEYYHRELIPRHFLPGAEAVYGYARRKEPGYKTPAIDRHGNRRPGRVERLIAQGKALARALTNPLIVTGTLERVATQLAVIRGFPSRATVTLNLPHKITANSRVARELTRVAGRERGPLATVLAKAMDREQAIEYAKTNQTIPIA